MNSLYDRADLELGWSDRGSACGSERSDLDVLPENRELYRFHRMTGRRIRIFRLVQLGTTKAGTGTKCVCDYIESDEDLFYPGYQVEWAYYKTKTPTVIDGKACYYTKVTHRLRYKAWIAEELEADMKDEAFKEEFLQIQKHIIEQKRGGRIDLDMSMVPMPVVTVAKQRSSKMMYEAPGEQVVTEAAFKFKASWHDFQGSWHQSSCGEARSG